jgi:hypothetical protein
MPESQLIKFVELMMDNYGNDQAAEFLKNMKSVEDKYYRMFKKKL